MDPAVQQFEREHEEATKIKNIQKIEFGSYEIDCWYFSPYPDEYSHDVDKLYICEKCLKYMKLYGTYASHYHECKHTGPPGKLIYMKDNLAVFELDGEKAKVRAKHNIYNIYYIHHSYFMVAVLPESVFAVKALPGSQDSVFRRQRIHVLRRLRDRPARNPPCRLL